MTALDRPTKTASREGPVTKGDLPQGEIARELASATRRQEGSTAASPLSSPPPDDVSAIGYLPGPLMEAMIVAGGLAQLSGQVLWSAIRRPAGYWRATLDEMFEIVRLCMVPVFFAVLTFDIMVSILGFSFLTLVGGNNLYAELFNYQSLREFSVWIMAITVAGIVGSALCADLGARKVREELDALRVLGVDPVRELVLPRVLAPTLITPLMLVFTFATGLAGSALGESVLGNVPATDFYHNMFTDISQTLLLGVAVESLIIGFIIGIVSAFKGMNCGSGPIGVGRAVNQAVVLIFVLIFVVDFIFMTTLVGLFPNLQQLR